MPHQILGPTSVLVRRPRRLCGPVAAFLSAVLSGFGGGCREKANAYAPPPPAEVTVDHPVRRPVTSYLEYTGSTEPYEQVDLRARVTGFLETVNFKPGAAVRKDDLLFVIDPRVYESEAKQAAAEVAAREAALRIAQLTMDRVSQALKASASNQQEFDRAVADRDEAQAQLDLAEATFTTARLNVEFTQVRAPIDGRITKNFVDVGNLVGSGPPPTVLATLVSTKPLFVTVDAREDDLLMVRRTRLAQTPGAEPGQVAPDVWRPVDLATADSEAFGVHGRIDYVDPALNPQTGTIRVRCRFENEDGVLLPGLFVRVRVHLETTEQMLVPDIALLSDQSGRFALVVNDKDVVEMRRVTVGGLDGAMRVVLDGLSDSDRVVVNGLQRARPGAAVKPTLKESQGSPAMTGTSPR